MDPNQNNNSSPARINAIDLYARAAATLYGIISFNDFVKILEVYYGEGILHPSIFPDEITSTLSEIRHSAFVPASRCYRILPQQEFLRYADPSFFEDTCGTRQMKEYLTDNLGIPQDDAEEIIAEMVFVCRCGASPTLVQDALTRRGLPFGRECYLDLITIACEMEPDIRRWEAFGYTNAEIDGT